jgi:hypothetical protein
MAPDGLDVRLSLDLALQRRADALMTGQRGAVVLMNAQSGEIFVMSSHPTFDPANLNEAGMQLNKDPDKPLINRATQGIYPMGTLVEPFIKGLFKNKTLDENDLQTVYETFGFDHAPTLRMPVAKPVSNEKGQDLHVSPLQVALASTAFSNHGSIPAPRIATAVNTPNDGWVVLPALGTPLKALSESAADEAAQSLIREGQGYWTHIEKAESDESTVTWFLGGTPPHWQATPLIVVVLLEEDNRQLAEEIGGELLSAAMNP